MLLSLVAMVLVIIVHELIHGIFFKIFGKGKLKFGFHGFAASCSMPTHYFNKKQFIIIGLAPFVLLDLILALLSFFLYGTDYFLVVWIALLANFSGCIGDLYVTFKLLKMKNTVLVNDVGVAMTMYDIEKEEIEG